MGTLVFWIGGVALVAIIGTIVIATCEHIGKYL